MDDTVTAPDLTNGLFELGGAVAAWLNVVRLHRDQAVRGVSAASFVFYTVWGLWNCYYYPHLGQWVSYVGDLAVLGANAVWVAMAALLWWVERA